jgi:dihydroorotate dehydrogenase (NAD+) catalytic subunit
LTAALSLETKVGRVTLKNPVLVASGTFGFAREYEKLFPVSALGGVMVTGVTLEPRAGNPPPRLVETPAGLLNSIGLQNPGVHWFIKEELPRLRDLGTEIIVNISGFSLEEYGRLAEILDREPGLAALEVNISCPNVKKGGMTFGVHPESAAAVTRLVRQGTSLPVWVKLSPNVTDIVEIAQAVVDAGADALSLINTLSGIAIDPDKRRPVLGNVFGGLSGPAVKPVALRMIWQVYQEVPVPLVGMGGITNYRDALEFIMAGATAVAVGTGLFLDPLSPLKIIEGLQGFLAKHQEETITNLIGAAHNREESIDEEKRE